jgi:hypothetical protein
VNTYYILISLGEFSIDIYALYKTAQVLSCSCRRVVSSQKMQKLANLGMHMIQTVCVLDQPNQSTVLGHIYSST